MTKQEMLTKIEEVGIMPAIRVNSAEDALFAAETIFKSGIPVVEVTMTTPAAIEVIKQLVRDHSDKVIGAGTVLDMETANTCAAAGAMFLTSTGLDPELVDFTQKHGMSMIPGALTPGEVMLAKKAGTSLIKIYPCANVGGPSYIKAIKRPFPNMHLIAAGGVTQITAGDYIRAGASVLGIGHDLLPQEAIRTRNADWIQELVHRFLGMVRHARADFQRMH